MHICHVTSALAGGPATSIALLSSRQAEAGHQLSLVYSSRRDELWVYRKRFDHFRTVVPWRVGRSIGPGDALALAELVGILRRLDPDLLHLHCSKAGALGRLAGRLLGLPSVYSPRGVSFIRTDRTMVAATYRIIERWLARGGESLVACSASEARHLREIARVVQVVPNAVDLDSIAGIVQPARPPDLPFTIGILGLIKDQRLPGLVRQICEQAPPSWRWIWIGDGPLRHLVDGLPNLRVTGWREHRDALQVLATADAVLHASRWEGMPNALLEAMALGKPIVVSDVVGTRDVVTDQVHALLVGDVYAVDPYLSALGRLGRDPRLRHELGTRARERVLQEHDSRMIAARWQAIYEQVLCDPRFRRARRRQPRRPPMGSTVDLSGLDV